MIKRELFKIGAGLFIFTALASFTVAQDPTPSPTVSPSPTELPTPMPSPTPTPNITPTPTPSPTLSPTVKMAMVAEYFPPTEKNSGGKISRKDGR